MSLRVASPLHGIAHDNSHKAKTNKHAPEARIGGVEVHDLDEGLDLLGVLAGHQKGLHTLLGVIFKVR